MVLGLYAEKSLFYSLITPCNTKQVLNPTDWWHSHSVNVPDADLGITESAGPAQARETERVCTGQRHWHALGCPVPG